LRFRPCWVYSLDMTKTSAPRYTTTDLLTGETVEVKHVKRAGVTFATWAKFSDGWSQVGASKVTSYAAAVKSARSAAPYATEWDATPTTEA
jgi:hypothetical protein